MTGKIQTATKNAAQQQTQTLSLQGYLKGYQKAFANALPKMITPERFTRMAMTALATNGKLAECTPQSFIGACLFAAQLGLEPNTPLGQAYLIPYNDNKKGVTECQFQIGYKGLLDLAYRSGEFANISAHIVYENDKFNYEYGLNGVLKHRPAKSNRGNAEYVYAVYNLKNGGYAFEVMSMEDVKTHAMKYSKQKSRYNGELTGPWKNNFEAMAKKTVIKQLLKYAPMKTEIAQAASYDGMKIEADITGGEPEAPLDLSPAYIIDDDTGEIEETESTIENNQTAGITDNDGQISLS